MQLDWTCRFNKVKAILQLKKSLNLGEVSEHFKIIANKLLELEGTFTDGFENNIKHLLNNNGYRNSSINSTTEVIHENGADGITSGTNIIQF